MVIRKCDRCGKTIENNYWTVSINEKQDKTRRNTFEGTLNNLSNNINQILENEKEYCKDCIKEIKEVIERKNKKEAEK